MKVPIAFATPEATDASPDQGHELVCAQLSKVLASPHFRNSKRSQALLRFVVEASLSESPQSLKERSIGVAVFARETSYDTAQDPIVRNAAIEVRKRLAQYYLEPEHASELRIDLPIGSYQPTFSIEEPTVAPPPRPPEPGPVARPASRRWVLAAALGAGCFAAALLYWSARRTPASELEALWEPLLREGKPIQICIGQPTRLYRFIGPRSEELNGRLGGKAQPAGAKVPRLSINAEEVAWVAPEYLYLRDSLSAFKVSSWIQSKGRPYQLASVSQTDYSRIRHAPLVAIGAFNNSWALRVTAELRFVFDRRTIDGVSANCITDRRNPAASEWCVKQPVIGAMSTDYAILTRVFDPATERTVISAAGIETFGTLAASEFVTEAEYVGAALQKAPDDWRHMNIQFVLATKIIDGTPGPPRVLATHVW